MPIDYKKYPKNWKTEIRPAILKRAGNRCELCGAPNHETVIRPGNRKTVVFRRLWYFESENLAIAKNVKKVKIILTIHHIDSNIKNNDHCNLIALCQRCHLRLDRPFKKVKRWGKK